MSDQREGESASLAALAAVLGAQEPAFSSLGTPVLADTDVTNALVRRGREAVPALLGVLDGDDSGAAMWAAYCLGRIGDPGVAPALRRTRDRYAAREDKRPGDYGVISAANEALDRLSEAPGGSSPAGGAPRNA